MEQKGETLGRALEIIRRTYLEINRLKDDFEELLMTHDPLFKFSQEYSYGTNSLHLKANHTFLFVRAKEETETDDFSQQGMVAIICIFYEESGLDRVSLKNQPEIWFAALDVLNCDHKIKPWAIYELLKLENRGEFSGNPLIIGGEVSQYHWKDDDTEEEWNGHFIGYPLVDITDIDALKEKVIDKLLAVT